MYVAMKGFTLDKIEDDYRDPYDVYEHEVKVYYDLRSLWGIYVPRLLFKSPWPWQPSVGHEMGTPMNDDFDEWNKSDKTMMSEAVSAIKGMGYKQTDNRGTNYVRLKNGRIVMIDFESVLKIKKND